MIVVYLLIAIFLLVFLGIGLMVIESDLAPIPFIFALGLFVTASVIVFIL